MLKPDSAVSMDDLSKEEILRMFEREYIKKGYIYSGSFPQNASVFRNRQNWEKAHDLVVEGKLQIRNCEGRSFELPVERRCELIEKHGLADEWEREAPFFHPNGPYGEVTCVYGRTEEVLKEQALKRLQQNEFGWFTYINGHNGRGPYKVQYWLVNHKQFTAGQITCECKGWIFSKKPKTCRHCDEMRTLLEQAGVLSVER